MDWTPFIAPGFTLAGVLSGVFITHRLSSNRFIKEKLWEQRREAYSQIISSVVNMSECTTRIVEGYGENPVQFHNSEYRDKVNDEMWAHWKEAKACFASNALIVSERFGNKMVDLMAFVKDVGSDPNEVMPEWIDSLRDRLKADVDALMAIGANELMPAGKRRGA